jgi:hypothetical protein
MFCNACQYSDLSYEPKISDRSGDYAFNTASILDSISKNSADVFTPIDDKLPFESSQAVTSISWDYSDFENVAKAFHQFFWGETMNTWKLHELSYAMACDAVNKPDVASFDIFITEKKRTRDSLCTYHDY